MKLRCPFRMMLKPVTLFVLVLSSCKNDEPVQPHVSSIQLSVEDVSCTEAWLKISLTDSAEPRTVAILKDGQRVSVASLRSPDSVLVIEGLLPRRAYTFLAQRLRDSTVIDASTPVQATTMDTTSHNFTWQIDTLGDGNSSTLYDVAIINDTLAYAVGEMYLRDSTGQVDPLLYNLAVWNGRRWDIRRLNYRGSPPVIRFVFAISERDIWFDPWFHWDGQRFNELPINPVFIGVGWNKMWGSSDGQLYVVGNSGAIVYSPDRGSTWQRVESGTTQPINDIWGEIDSVAGNKNVFAIASNIWQGGEKRVLRIDGTTVTAINNAGLPWALSGVWFSRNKMYIAGDGLFKRSCINCGSGWTSFHRGLANYYSHAVRGDGVQLVVAGSFGEVLTFNGATWKNHVSQTYMSGGEFTAVAVRKNFIIAVGYVGNRGIALIGRRVGP